MNNIEESIARKTKLTRKLKSDSIPKQAIKIKL